MGVKLGLPTQENTECVWDEGAENIWTYE